ncbi:hypothetical protein LJR290_007642 [Variovorax sp. LjRoot290]|uniref:hypothetical protein n=1 Tax=Variovorax sp. LjRoot290 TaxID=3342316 RepID=UPI003ED0A08E
MKIRFRKMVCMNADALNCPRTLNAWVKADDKKLLTAIDGGLTVHEASEALQREPVSVLRRVSSIGAFEFESGSEEWVEIMSLALSGVPLQDVIAWCSASDERMPYDLLDAMRSGPDQRPAFELARELAIEVPNVDALVDLAWLLERPIEIRLGYAAAAGRVLARFDALTPASLKSEVLGIAPADLRWMGGTAPKTRRGSKAAKAGTANARPPRNAASTSRARKPKIRNRWAYANYLKKKRASASGKY